MLFIEIYNGQFFFKKVLVTSTKLKRKSKHKKLKQIVVEWILELPQNFKFHVEEFYFYSYCIYNEHVFQNERRITQ